MEILKRKINQKVGLPPGTPIYTGGNEEKTTITQIVYDEENFTKSEILSINDIFIEPNKVNWININGLADIKKIMEIGEQLNIHSLLIEDVLNIHHIAKIEEEKESISIVLKNFVQQDNEVVESHSFIYYKDNLIVTFNEFSNIAITRKIQRYETNVSRGRKLKADYLLFSILDTIIDSYYICFENLREDISKLEEKLFEKRRENHIDDIYSQKKKLNNYRKIIFPVREILRIIINNEYDKIEEANYIFFRDCENHIQEIMEYHDSFRELLSGLLNLNESNLNNDTNKIVKILTMISSLFIPLSFIAGVYGMNFKYMPELESKYGYFIVLGVMFSIAASTIIYLKKKRWL